MSYEEVLPSVTVTHKMSAILKPREGAEFSWLSSAHVLNMESKLQSHHIEITIDSTNDSYLYCMCANSSTCCEVIAVMAMMNKPAIIIFKPTKTLELQTPHADTSYWFFYLPLSRPIK